MAFNTTFVSGDLVKVVRSLGFAPYGLDVDKTYIVSDVVITPMPFGTFVEYILKEYFNPSTIGTEEYIISNGHLLLEKA